MPRLTKDEHIAVANEFTAEIARTERAIERMKMKRARAMLEANRAGATYPELVRRCRVSDGYVAKAIRAARATAPLRLAESPGRSSAA